jgi:uncharacterized protein with GYD domain
MPGHREVVMTIYITQGRYSHQAIKGLVAKPEDREAEVRKLIEGSGGKLLAFYMTFGEYDFLIITENKNEEDALSPIAVATAGGGVSHTRTVTAITPAAAKRVFEKANKLAGSFRSAGT